MQGFLIKKHNRYPKFDQYYSNIGRYKVVQAKNYQIENIETSHDLHL